MYKVKVENPCNCFNKSGFAQSSEFDSKEKAKEESEYLMRIMQSTFCQKHLFSVDENDEGFTISINDRA